MAHEEIRSPKVFKSTAPFSLATRTTRTRLLHVSGQVAQGLDGEVASKGDNSSAWMGRWARWSRARRPT